MSSSDASPGSESGSAASAASGSTTGSTNDPAPSSRELLLEFLASLAFRFRHVTSGAPDGFGDFDAGSGVRTPAATVRHMTGLIAWARSQYEESSGTRHELEPLSFDSECERFLATVGELVRAIEAPGAAGAGLHPSSQLTFAQLWRGPLIDAMTHVGQLATLRRLAGSPVERVRYWQVETSGALEDDPGASRGPP